MRTSAGLSGVGDGSNRNDWKDREKNEKQGYQESEAAAKRNTIRDGCRTVCGKSNGRPKSQVGEAIKSETRLERSSKAS